jgi:predicted membrane chloride channel (bestrophin family)
MTQTKPKRLNASIAACDKLLRYPIPLAYTRHTSRFMFVWLSALPFGLLDAGLGWCVCTWGRGGGGVRQGS